MRPFTDRPHASPLATGARRAVRRIAVEAPSAAACALRRAVEIGVEQLGHGGGTGFEILEDLENLLGTVRLVDEYAAGSLCGRLIGRGRCVDDGTQGMVEVEL